MTAREGGADILKRISSPGPAPARLRGGRLQTFVENTRSYGALPRRSHSADFRIEPVTERKHRDKFFWIMDGAQKIGILNLSFGELEMLRFFPPPSGIVVEYPMPMIYHWSTLRGARITIVPQGTWTGKGTMEWLESPPELLRLQYVEESADETRFVQHFTLRFDSVLGYVLDCEFEMQSREPTEFEYTNVLAADLANSRDEKKRYQKCIWARGDGELCYLYQNPLCLMQRASSDWSHLPETGSFVGFVAESDMNPFLEIIRSAPGERHMTCSTWYDQHVLVSPPERPGEDGFYRASATYRFLSLPLPVAKELEDAARTALPEFRPGNRMGFRPGIVNDLEASIPAGALYNGCLWGHHAALDRSVGRSGSRSLRVKGSATAQPIHGGTPIHVDSEKRYRLSAWVRTKRTSGKGAFLRINECFYDWDDVRRTHSSQALTGDNDWTLLSVEFEPIHGDPFAMPGLAVDGEGVAWFDDIQLAEMEE
jgi:hypothetical protein